MDSTSRDEIKRLSNYCCWCNFERSLFSWQNRFLKIEFRKKPRNNEKNSTKNKIKNNRPVR